MKEKTLSEKRKELFEELWKEGYREKDLFVIFNTIEEQDKQAIKKLREKYWKSSYSIECKNFSIVLTKIDYIIKEIFGKELVE